jgi:hypothetical protein
MRAQDFRPACARGRAGICISCHAQARGSLGLGGGGNGLVARVEVWGGFEPGRALHRHAVFANKRVEIKATPASHTDTHKNKHYNSSPIRVRVK